MVLRPKSSPPRLPKLALTYRNIDDLKPDPGNPRVRSRQVQRRLERSIAEFGPVFPITVDRNDVVIAGHARLEGMKALGYQTVPTIRLEHLNEAQAKVLQLLDNRLVEQGKWDERLLGEALQGLTIQGIDLDITLTGFDVGEIDLYIEGLSEQLAVEEGVDLAPTAGAVAVSRKGDLWFLNDHRVLCGNSLEAADVDAAMSGSVAHAVFTDQPYNLKIDGHVSGLGEVKHREFAMASGEMSGQEFRQFLIDSAAQIGRPMKPGAIAFMCMDWRHIEELVAAGKQTGLELINICVWVKAPGMGSMWRSSHEFVAVFRKPGAGHRNNVQLGKYGRTRTNVWNYSGMTGFGRHTDEGDLLRLHPTCKPVPMVADAILDVTARGEIVFDPFLGSGTTLIAAERVGRRCFAIELDELYVDVAIRRWQRLTGGVARHAATGRTFREIEQEGWE